MLSNSNNTIKFSLLKTIVTIVIVSFCTSTTAQDIPYLKKEKNKTQLIVDNKPFLMLAGELSNSISGSIEHMLPSGKPLPRKEYSMVGGTLGNDTSKNMDYDGSVWDQMVDLNVNTVLVAISWEMIEPEEGKFNFTVVDAILKGAREKNLKVIPLWFGTWKNGMSSYAPLWVKKDYKRFPRSKTKNSGSVEVVSTLSLEARNADAKAFSELMKHIKKVDSEHRTVIMVQVENEVGLMEDSRDRSAIAEKEFKKDVPKALIEYLIKNKKTLMPQLKELWASSGYKKSGSWEEVFGSSVWTDLAFMSWQYATYMNYVTKLGKEEYNLPMFVNAWLEYEGSPLPGGFPTGGPLPRVKDIWKAGAPDIDFMSPDIYGGDFVEWCNQYTTQGDPLFIPETWWTKPEYVGYMLYAIGNYNTLGVAPFGIDRVNPKDEPLLREMYSAVNYLSPSILESQGNKDKISAFLLSKDKPFIEVSMGDYIVRAELYKRKGSYRVEDAYGVILKTGDNHFTITGSKAVITFIPKDKTVKAGIGTVDEYIEVNNKWIKGRRLGGDETNRGKGVFLPVEGIGIQKAEIYTYK